MTTFLFLKCLGSFGLGFLCGFQIARGSALSLVFCIFVFTGAFFLPVETWQESRLNVLLLIFVLSGFVAIIFSRKNAGQLGTSGSDGDARKRSEGENLFDEFGNSYVWGKGKYANSVYIQPEETERRTKRAAYHASRPQQNRHSHAKHNNRADARKYGQQQSHTSEILRLEEKLRMKHLKTLGLNPTDQYSFEQIKRAFRIAAKKSHPDKGGSSELFMAVNEAWEWFANRHLTEERLRKQKRK